MYIACFRPIDCHVENELPEISKIILNSSKWDLKASVLDAYCTYFLYLSIGLHSSMIVKIVGNPMCHIFPYIILVTRVWVEQ
jgi:hypothetical protein